MYNYLLISALLLAGNEFPRFSAREIDPHVGRVCYAVTLADVNGDGRLDIVAVTENAVLWYENPSWRKRVIIENQTRADNVCIAPYDIDGDGRIDFALGAGWTRVGTIQWLSRGKSLEENWQVHPISAEPWLHRMRWGDVLGAGKAQLVISPLNRTSGQGVRLLVFQIPPQSATDSWKATVIDNTLNRMHNHWVLDWDGDGTDEVLTASQEGVYLFRGGRAGSWTNSRLGTGASGTELLQQGAGEIKVGRLARDRRFIATIEPMHGNQVVVYTPRNGGEGLWARHVLDDTLREGHAVWPADVDRDGADELIIGHREKGPGPVAGPGVYIYDANDVTGSSWQKHVLDDGGMATEDLIAADLDDDGWMDIVAGGRATHNLKLYHNLGRGE